MRQTIISRITRVAVLLPAVFCGLFATAQTTIPERINYVLETQDIDMGLKLYNEITEADLVNLPDSVLFDYHYLGGYINSEIPNHEKAIIHLSEAKRLCDTSLGTHSGAYMEIMKGLGDEYIELEQYEDALDIFQEGITKSMYMRKIASHDFGNLIIGVQDCYELLGWFNEIPNHLLDAWSFWDKDEIPLVTYTYYPLWCLEQFYKRYGQYDNALSTSHHIETFIKSKGGETHPELANALYMKGNILVEMNRTNDGIKAYQEGLDILRKNGMDSSELFRLLSGNLLSALVAEKRFEECDDIIDSIQQYSIKTGKPDFYKNALFSAANKAANIGNYEKAIAYNNELLNLDITDEEKPIIEDQRSTILYNQEAVEGLHEFETMFTSLQCGSSDWFEVGHKLSSAYYLLNYRDKNTAVLVKMYQAININKSVGSDYYLWVLNNLLGLSLETESYQEALRYAKEKQNYLSELSDVPDEYIYNAINDVIVAKLKSQTIDSIDSDLERIEKYYRSRYGEISSRYAIYLHNRGRAYQLQNKLDEAKNTLLKSITIQNKVDGKPFEGTVKYYMEVEQQLAKL
jgi:tetratricopeptide (TPR) repeat protein